MALSPKAQQTLARARYIRRAFRVGQRVARAVARASDSPARRKNISVATPYLSSRPDVLPKPDGTFAIEDGKQATPLSIRGEMEIITLAAIYHDPKAHAEFRPLSRSAALAFDMLERIRVEYVGLLYEGERYPRLREELDAAFDVRQQSLGFVSKTLSPVAAVEQFARASMLKDGGFYTPATGRVHDWLWKHRQEIYGRRFNRLLFTAMDQRAFAATALSVLSEVGFNISHKERGEAEEELKQAMERTVGLREKWQGNDKQTAGEEGKVDAAISAGKRSLGRISRKILSGIDRAMYKFHGQVFRFTDFFRTYGGVLKNRVIKPVFQNAPLVLFPLVVGYLLIRFVPELIRELIKDPIKIAWHAAFFLTAVGLYAAASNAFSKENRLRMKRRWRLLKKKYMPWFLSRELWRAEQVMQQVAANQFNHYSDKMTRAIAMRAAVAADYASYQRFADERVPLSSMAALKPDEKGYRDFSLDLAKVENCVRKEARALKSPYIDDPVTRWVYDMLDGEKLDPRRLPLQIIDPLAEALHMQEVPDEGKKKKLTVTLALGPDAFRLRMMPHIFAICEELENKGYRTEVMASFVEAKQVFKEGYGRANPVKTVFIKQAKTGIKRARSAFRHAHNINFPEAYLFGEAVLDAVNHARARHGEKTIIQMLPSSTTGSWHRTFKGKIREANETLEAREFDAQVVRATVNAAQKGQFFGSMVGLSPSYPASQQTRHQLAHQMLSGLKNAIDRHPDCR